MNVTLREITSGTVRDVVKLAVSPQQEKFVAQNALSLSEALFSKEAWYRAVYADDALVGFVMVYDESLRPQPPEEPKIGLWRLMVDHRFQRKGIGRAILQQVIAHARSRGFKELFTSYVPGPGCPEPFYRSLGFVPNGEVEDGEIVIVLPLGAN
jgi:diamine N-acetyltransferase